MKRAGPDSQRHRGRVCPTQSYGSITEAEQQKIRCENQHPQKGPQKQGVPGEPYMLVSLGAICEVGSDGRWDRDVGNS